MALHPSKFPRDWRWRLYGALIVGLSWLHYAVLSRFSNSDEGGEAWFRKRLDPALPAAVEQGRIWIHAVSAGESKVAELLRAALLGRDARLSVVLSATTYSGFARIEQIAGAEHSFIMPIDTPRSQARLMERLQPDAMVVIESEFWPAQFTAAAEAGVPVAVVNATMSERSFRRHSHYPVVARRTLMTARRIYAQDSATLSRYRQLGVAEDRLALSGNLKMAAAGSLDGRGRRPVVVFGNIHRDELAILAPAIRALASTADLRVILVPRYPGRIGEGEIRAELGPDIRLVTDPDQMSQGDRLVWVDRMGVLGRLYESARVGVVCGTFCDVGGHDLSEPLQRGAGSVFGPRTERQRLLRAELTERTAATEVQSAAELVPAVLALIEDEERRLAMLARFGAAAEEARHRLLEIADELIALSRR